MNFLRAAVRLSAVLIPALPLTAHGGALNDTGIDQCIRNDGDDSCTYADVARGRDAAAAAGMLPKIGGGSKGFDFTKIANNGAVLPANATLGPNPADWACTYDNTTGLMWEIKTSDGLRSLNHTYTWYDSVQGIGSANGGVCWSDGRCDTEKFVADVNATTLCGHANWRVPAMRELNGIMDFGIASPGPMLDAAYFPNVAAGLYWSSTRYTGTPPSLMPLVRYTGIWVWAADFAYGSTFSPYTAGYGGVRILLVRGGL